jgi:Zn finger protein HypA/HybF involved in hydrogenase expression
MHDFSTAQAFADAITKKVKSKKLKEMQVFIAIGALLGLNPGQVEFWLLEMLKKKFGDKVDIRIFTEVIQPEIKCKCGFAGAVESFEAGHDMAHHGVFEMKCPKCGAEDYEIVKGRETQVSGIKAK